MNLPSNIRIVGYRSLNGGRCEVTLERGTARVTKEGRNADEARGLCLIEFGIPHATSSNPNIKATIR